MSVSTLSQERTSLLRSKAHTLAKVGEIAEAAADAISAVYPDSGTVTILSESWEEDNTADYPAYYDISLAGVLATDRADILFAGANLATAAECGISAITETSAGNIRIRAVEAPTTNITAIYWITHKEESA